MRTSCALRDKLRVPQVLIRHELRTVKTPFNATSRPLVRISPYKGHRLRDQNREDEIQNRSVLTAQTSKKRARCERVNGIEPRAGARPEKWVVL